jgi:TRAP-type C4-dicarboxylate transport system permease small subunit
MFGRIAMLRSLYLATLVALQMALVARVAPPVAEALRVDALAGLAPDGWLALLQLFATGLAVGGAALALVFPGIALARHRRAGAMRFLGLPRWAVGMSLCGIVLLGAAALGSTLAPTLPRHLSHDRLSCRPAGAHRRPRFGRRRSALRRAPAPQRRRA